MKKEGGKEEDVLPGLNLSTDQLFYLSAAHVWCGKVTSKAGWDYDLREVHSPMRYRLYLYIGYTYISLIRYDIYIYTIIK